MTVALTISPAVNSAGQPSVAEAGDDLARLQAADQEGQRLDAPGHQVPDEEALQARRRPDVVAAVPRDVEPDRETGDDAGAAELVRRPERQIGRRQRDEDFRRAGR